MTGRKPETAKDADWLRRPLSEIPRLPGLPDIPAQTRLTGRALSMSAVEGALGVNPDASLDEQDMRNIPKLARPKSAPSAPSLRTTPSRISRAAIDAVGVESEVAVKDRNDDAITARELLPEELTAAQLPLGPGLQERPQPQTLLPRLFQGALKELVANSEFKESYRLARLSLERTASADVDHMPEAVAEERRLVGSIADKRVREVLLYWIAAASLEALRHYDSASRIISRCAMLDPGNALHPYNRGVCMLHLGNAEAARRDFGLAIAECTQQGESPPMLLVAARALASCQCPGRMNEVWGDFQLIRARTVKHPYENLNLHLLMRKLLLDTGGVSAYREAMLLPLKQSEGRKHWATVLASHSSRLLPLTPKEVQTLAQLIRKVADMHKIPPGVLEDNITRVTARSLPPGSPVLPQSYWYCVVAGNLDVVRFAPDLPVRRPPDEEPSRENEVSLLRRVAVPLHTKLRQEVVGHFGPNSTFQGGDHFGPHGDGWLVVSSSCSAEIICLPTHSVQSMCMQGEVSEHRTSRLSGDEEETFLRRTLLIDDDAQFVRVRSLFDRRAASFGADLLTLWPGMLIIDRGELRVLGADGKELCLLGAGDVLAEEVLVGGDRLPGMVATEVLSVNLEAWVLPKDREKEVRTMEFLQHVRYIRSFLRKQLELKVAHSFAWSRVRKRIISECELV